MDARYVDRVFVESVLTKIP